MSVDGFIQLKCNQVVSKEYFFFSAGHTTEEALHISQPRAYSINCTKHRDFIYLAKTAFKAVKALQHLLHGDNLKNRSDFSYTKSVISKYALRFILNTSVQYNGISLAKTNAIFVSDWIKAVPYPVLSFGGPEFGERWCNVLQWETAVRVESSCPVQSR